ncbi:glycoside hydrolase family protein [Sphingobacterium bovistauri]|uniref:Glycoside hydrolase family protein n=1 Tax=Sphingobacterium bovistauri TaxID=2781959 RepID=A0ABS7Z2M4_9SPHI|nr:glycoside hydrolase family protein [Sphingobacterium bovistauri]MCA5003857.1 glycoside hydrolase family protein [Sphingobacterium bovistauri]
MLTRKKFLVSVGVLCASTAFGFSSSEKQSYFNLKPIGRTFYLPEYFVWCSSPIWGKDNKVYLFYSRWRKDKGMSGWINGSEIGYAIADSPLHEFVHQDVIIAPRVGYWDSTTCHNPLIKEFNGKYYLYYMGNSNGKTSTKHIGVAYSDSLNGPWKRLDEPILMPGTEGAWDDHCTTNPAVMLGNDNKYWLYYKSWNTAEYLQASGSVRGNRKYGLAKSDSPLGPFVKDVDNPIIDFSNRPNNAQVEDAYIWNDNKGYHLIARDMGFYNHEYGLYMYSRDGKKWTEPKVSYLNMAAYIKEENPTNLKRFGRLERPMLLQKNNNGKPQFLFGATQGGIGHTATTFVFQIL